MRRNSKILLVFGVVWFLGVMFYVKHSDGGDSGHHKAKVHGGAKHPRSVKGTFKITVVV